MNCNWRSDCNEEMDVTVIFKDSPVKHHFCVRHWEEFTGYDPEAEMEDE